MNLSNALKMFVLLGLLLAGFKSIADDTSPEIFSFATNIPMTQRKTVQDDLSSLNGLQLVDPDGSAARVFKIPMLPSELKKWLSARSKYLVHENFSYESDVRILTPNFSYPNASVFPYLELVPIAKPESHSGQRVVTLMANAGTHIYRIGKRAKNLLSAIVPGFGAITVTSPRTGIFKVGEGLFIPLIKNDINYTSLANSIRRLGIYFHEARHSDGNGKSLGFLHAPCPAEKGVFAGSYACDRNQNGPYTIEAQFVRSAVDSCRRCSRVEKEALRNIYADKFSRVLTEGIMNSESTNQIPTDSTLESCESLSVLNIDVGSVPACGLPASADESAATSVIRIPAPVVILPEPRPALLDDRPEMIGPL